MVAARLPGDGVTAVWHTGRDRDEVPGVKDVLSVMTHAAGLALHNRADGELRVTVAFVRLRTLPGAAQLKA
ncbi:hypothetical protein KAM576c_05380 [Enterobacter asburiae]|nr:hypothetical protein KAM576c_05380 [Enterobacter asburiae]